MPPGFIKVTAGERVAICDPADEAWVKTALTSASPATKPSTMPADLVQRLTDRRAALAKQIGADFGISDPAAIDKYIEQKINPDLRKLQRRQVPLAAFFPEILDSPAGIEANRHDVRFAREGKKAA